MKLILAIALAGSAFIACGPHGHDDHDAGPPATCPEGGTGDGGGGGTARTWTCNFSEKKFAPNTTHATNCSDTNLQVDVSYSASETASGDVFVSAVVDVPSSPPALSSSQVWSAGSPGANQGADTLADDICRSGGPANPGTWSFTLDKTTGTLTSVYSDADLIAGEVTFTTPCIVSPAPATLE
jgi:hypothetical protein